MKTNDIIMSQIDSLCDPVPTSPCKVSDAPKELINRQANQNLCNSLENI